MASKPCASCEILKFTSINRGTSEIPHRHRPNCRIARGVQSMESRMQTASGYKQGAPVMADDRREKMLVHRPRTLEQRAVALAQRQRPQISAEERTAFQERQAATDGQRFQRKVAGTIRTSAAHFFAR